MLILSRSRPSVLTTQELKEKNLALEAALKQASAVGPSTPGAAAAQPLPLATGGSLPVTPLTPSGLTAPSAQEWSHMLAAVGVESDMVERLGKARTLGTVIVSRVSLPTSQSQPPSRRP